MHTAFQITHGHPALSLLHLWIVAQNFISQPWQVIHPQLILLPWDLQKETEGFNSLNYKLPPTYKKPEFCDLEYSGSLCLARVREHSKGKESLGWWGHTGETGTGAILQHWAHVHLPCDSDFMQDFHTWLKFFPRAKEQVSTDTGITRNHHTICLPWNMGTSYNGHFE